MEAFFRDQFWPFLGVIVGIVAMIITIILGRRKKELSCELNTTELVKVDARVTDKLQVSFDGKKVSQLHLVLLRFFNSGYSDIDDKDFRGNIDIAFGENAQILKAEVSEKEPENIKIVLKNSENKAELEPTLLNRKYTFTLMFLISNFKKVSVNCQIKGIWAIKMISPNDLPTFWFPVTVAGLIILLIGMVLTSSNPASIQFNLLSFTGISLMFVPSMYQIVRKFGTVLI